jgi:putative membrane protein insertion efficiency factor
MIFIRLYQKIISPFLPPSCRFIPSCSEYTYQALEKYGALKGSILSMWRLLRCNPFNKGGYDPVK